MQNEGWREKGGGAWPEKSHMALPGDQCSGGKKTTRQRSGDAVRPDTRGEGEGAKLVVVTTRFKQKTFIIWHQGIANATQTHRQRGGGSPRLLDSHTFSSSAVYGPAPSTLEPKLSMSEVRGSSPTVVGLGGAKLGALGGRCVGVHVG